MAIKKFLSESGFKHFVEKVIGKTDISSVGDGTLKGAVSSLNIKLDAANNNISKKQDASTAITTSNISNQSVKYATSAGSSNSAGIADKTTAIYNGNPSPICPSLSNSQVQFLWNTNVMRVDVYVDKTYIGHIVTN